MDDLDLFRNAMGDVKPIRNDNNTVLHKRSALNDYQRQERQRAATHTTQLGTFELTMEHVEFIPADDPICYKKDGVQEGVYRNLRLGKYELGSTLNLHGLTVLQASNALSEFIVDCQRANIRAVLIQHGRGLKNSENKAVLKSYLNQWLRQMEPILAFHSAQPQHGGNGAVYVLIKKSDDARLNNKERHQKRGAN